jgi:hypothetical protein
VCVPLIESVITGQAGGNEATRTAAATTFTLHRDYRLLLGGQSRNLAKKKTNKTKLRGLSPRAIYTERPPLVGEVSANFCG